MNTYFSKAKFLEYIYEIRFIILFYVIGDLISTYYAMPVGQEFNPFPAMVIEKYGIFYLMVLKIGLILGFFFIFPGVAKYPRKWFFTKRIIELFGVLATVNNIMVILYQNSLIQAIGLI